MPDQVTTLHRMDRFFSTYLDCDLAQLVSGQIALVGSDRRYQREAGYGFVHVLWLIVTHGRCAISARHEWVEPLRRLFSSLRDPDELRAGRFDASILQTCSDTLPLAGLSLHRGPKYACCEEDFRSFADENVRSIAEDSAAPGRVASATCQVAEVSSVLCDAGLALPYTVEEKTAFAYYLDDRPVACCGTLPIGHMEGEVSDVGSVYTLPAMRRRGFARAVVSATTAAVLRAGRVPAYSTWEQNIASQRTARSVGYREYGWALYIKHAA